MTGEILFQADNISKTFGGLKAVDNVSFALRAGIVTTLVGPNGAGKTTLFNAMTGHLVPDQGAVTFLGESILGLPHWKVARLGIKLSWNWGEKFYAFAGQFPTHEITDQDGRLFEFSRILFRGDKLRLQFHYDL